MYNFKGENEFDQLVEVLEQIIRKKEYSTKYEDVPKGICGRPSSIKIIILYPDVLNLLPLLLQSF